MSDPVIRADAATDRRIRILSRLRADGFLAVNDLTRELQVSHMTVRRDLHALEEAGQVRMVHGGVSLTPESLRTVAFPDDGNADARLRIARYAAGLVDPSETVVIDAGPTALAVARALLTDFRGSIITHSMPVLQLLDDQPGSARTVALGGELLVGRHAFAGPATEAALDELRARTYVPVRPRPASPRWTGWPIWSPIGHHRLRWLRRCAGPTSRRTFWIRSKEI